MLVESIKKVLEEKDFFSLLNYGLLIPFDLYWVKQSGKKVLLKSKGEFSQRSHIQKYIDSGADLNINSSLKEDWVLQVLEKLSELEELCSKIPAPQRDIQNWRFSFLKWISASLWEELDKTTRIDVCFSFGSFFFNLDEEQEKEFLNFPIEIQRKNYLSGCFGVLCALLLGYTDTKFLKDYFSILLFMDYPFCKEMWSESEKEFLESEWQSRGPFQGNKTETKNRVLAKYIVEIKRAKKVFANQLTFKGLKKYLDFSFEKINGQGSRELFATELSDLDMLTIFLYHRFSFNEEITGEESESLLKNLFNVSHEFKEVSLAKRLEKLMFSSVEMAQGEGDEYLKISGL